MIKTGLVSVSFRKFDVDKIIGMVQKAGLAGIEWGGDVHVPHGDVKTAERVRASTENAGLEVAAYGSYYRVGCEKKYDLTFGSVLESAIALKAPTIRVWAGDIGSDHADESLVQNTIEETDRIAKMASKYDIDIAYEFHANTLTDTIESTMQLLENKKMDSVYSYWQPPIGTDESQQMAMIDRLEPYLSNIHVYYWKGKERRRLEEDMPRWTRLMDKIRAVKGDRYAMIEFVKDDEERNFYLDAAALSALADPKGHNE